MCYIRSLLLLAITAIPLSCVPAAADDHDVDDPALGLPTLPATPLNRISEQVCCHIVCPKSCPATEDFWVDRFMPSGGEFSSSQSPRFREGDLWRYKGPLFNTERYFMSSASGGYGLDTYELVGEIPVERLERLEISFSVQSRYPGGFHTSFEEKGFTVGLSARFFPWKW
ncbi:MAG: hypothetical protein HZA80_00055 [Candidatus Taylorbacteria bacterium]|nr:hypothetical protein [Candidatus Taylorbacteria bacterium]